jgi:hydroxymethylglutaryl-CoA lyase
MAASVELVECPRDAWQGQARIIATADKISYLRRLIELGFRHLDAVSFVSPRYVPQMADSEQVLQGLLRDGWRPDVEIIGIVVNDQGIRRALATAGVSTLGYPHSVSPSFLQVNAHLTPDESLALVRHLVRVCSVAHRGHVVYLSMAFGNPYGDPWSEQMVADTIVELRKMGVQTLALADTVGLATASQIARLLEHVRPVCEGIRWGVHLHGRPAEVEEKVLAAWEAGCRRFDTALTGLGGCPFAGDELVGNIPTEIVVRVLQRRGIHTGISESALEEAVRATMALRGRYGF